ncbi:hypothetical protein ABTP12_15940, partial [Acinetobacter baumannii]
YQASTEENALKSLDIFCDQWNHQYPMHYLLGLQLAGVSMNHKAVTFKAESPRLNTAKTGDIFALDRFTGLKGAI